MNTCSWCGHERCHHFDGRKCHAKDCTCCHLTVLVERVRRKSGRKVYSHEPIRYGTKKERN